ncbi:protein draper-like, partial [Saccostrea cucullata]|uniref:protein draper-like n=1 Tax=Saccostrea cuccullata TaxID=36930 RepID=UPI002ED4C6D9
KLSFPIGFHRNESECCVDYYQESGTCKVCPEGWFGENCIKRCPENQYGSLCLGICYCNPNETCDHILGCLQKGVCTGHDGEFKCCINYYQHIKNKCEVCFPGTYGHNCEDNCPYGTYGYLCRQKCKCNSDAICDKRFGCVDQEYPPGSFGENCSEECPSGFYGHFCEEKCTCEDQCDKQNGCVQTTSAADNLGIHYN